MKIYKGSNNYYGYIFTIDNTFKNTKDGGIVFSSVSFDVSGWHFYNNDQRDTYEDFFEQFEECSYDEFLKKAGSAVVMMYLEKIGLDIKGIAELRIGNKKRTRK